MESLGQGTLRKMAAELAEPIEYSMRLGKEQLPLNELIGHTVRLRHLGAITCVHCGRATSRSFNQGYCYPCFTTLAACDRCVMSPELCHFEAGTCREPEWGEQNCMQPHFVYLANSSGPKVGITRQGQIPVRWIDQGAVQALPVMRVATRMQSGLAEAIFRQEISDRTQWQRMLKSEGEPIDMIALRDELLDKLAGDLTSLQQRFGLQDIQIDLDAEPLMLRYPVVEYPDKVRSHNLDKSPEFEGTLLGIKGQYLMLDSGVINLRKYTAYHVEFYA